jgi:hypothetical protein
MDEFYRPYIPTANWRVFSYRSGNDQRFHYYLMSKFPPPLLFYSSTVLLERPYIARM